MVRMVRLKPTYSTLVTTLSAALSPSYTREMQIRMFTSVMVTMDSTMTLRVVRRLWTSLFLGVKTRDSRMYAAR